MKERENKSQIVIYQTEDGQAKVSVQFHDDTVWLTQKLMAELYEVSVPTIIRNFRITAQDGKSYDTKHYNLDMIISLGYRVNSRQNCR